MHSNYCSFWWKKFIHRMAPVARIRNRNCVPYLEKEGELSKPLDLLGTTSGSGWGDNLVPHDRMHVHHTLASVRRYAHFQPCAGLIPQDNLDFKLDSSYEHGKEIFPDRVDVVLQPETRGLETWRRLQNTRDIGVSGVPTCAERKKWYGTKDLPKVGDKLDYGEGRGGVGGASGAVESSGYSGYSPMIRDLNYEKGMCTDILKIYTKPYNKHHPVRIGGILERRHPSNIKLMNSSHHSPQTNAGYTRKEGDGNLFNY